MTHTEPAALAPRLRPIVGSATLAIALSSTDSPMPNATTIIAP